MGPYFLGRQKASDMGYDFCTSQTAIIIITGTVGPIILRVKRTKSTVALSCKLPPRVAYPITDRTNFFEYRSLRTYLPLKAALKKL